MKNFLKKHKWKIIVTVLVLFVLGFTFWYGGNAPGLRGWNAAKSEAASVSASPTASSDISPGPSTAETQVPVSPDAQASAEPAKADESAVPLTSSDHPLSASEKVSLAKSIGGDKSSEGVEKGNTDYSASQGMTINPNTGKDQYQTDPVPSGKPVPVEPQNTTITDKVGTCTLSVRCDTILNNMNLLSKDKWELVPKDGVIFAMSAVSFHEGESVFNVLQREMKRAKIQMEFKNTPMYNSAYIEGINNLYEFDVGELSGWMYKVNGWFPNYGCSRYQLKDGDVVEWVYTCALGKDVGGYCSVGS